MDLIVNDLSVHGQFFDRAVFRSAIQQMMRIRRVAGQFGRQLYCHRSLASTEVAPTFTMQQMVGSLAPDERRALMAWLTQQGPFWDGDDLRKHSPDDWVEYGGVIVTDTGLGEAAVCRSLGLERGVVSFVPSDWQSTPLVVSLVDDEAKRRQVEVTNLWSTESVCDALEATEDPVESWQDLEVVARRKFESLVFSLAAFAPLEGVPFNSSAAQRVLVLLNILNELQQSFDSDGRRTARGHELYQNYFTGKKDKKGRGSLFSDSSDKEKRRFGEDMVFDDPRRPGERLSCTWHGKVQTPPLRVHFAWPMTAGQRTVVAYIGLKITRR